MPQIEEAQPKYLQIAHYIRDQILRGDLRPGDEVPSERQLAADWKVSRPTAARSLEALSHQGLVEKRQGMVGTKDESLRDRVHRPGVLFSAGLITGEALMGIAVGVAIYASEDREVLALPAAFQQGEIVGLAVLAVVAWLLYRTGTRERV